jgi:transcriptional regulator with XRE-family HTH domain
MNTAPSRRSSKDETNQQTSHLNGNGYAADGKPLHCIAAVRRRQGVSLRTVARRWNLDVAQIRNLEDATADLKLSQLYAWQQLLEVPVHELLVDSELLLSPNVFHRAQLLRLMKTAVSLSDKSSDQETRHLVDRLVNQIVEIMPELKTVGPWHEPDDQFDDRDQKIYHLPNDS